MVSNVGRESIDIGEVVSENPAPTVRTVTMSSPLQNVGIFWTIFPIL